MKDCSMDTKKKAYTALVCLLLEYADLVWSPHLHISTWEGTEEINQMDLWN